MLRFVWYPCFKATLNGWYSDVQLLRIGEYLDGSVDGVNLEMMLGDRLANRYSSSSFNFASTV